MLAPDLQRRPEVAAVRELALAAAALVAGLRHGRHAQPLVGAGPEVWGVRPYRQGDDAAQVDWKRSARGDRLYSRERADTSHTQAVLIVDASRSMGVGHRAGEPSKLEIAQVVAAALGTLLVEQGDTVGLYAATAPETWLGPGGGAHHGHVHRRGAGAARAVRRRAAVARRRGGGRAAAPALVAGRALGRLGWSRLRRGAAPRRGGRPRCGRADDDGARRSTDRRPGRRRARGRRDRRGAQRRRRRAQRLCMPRRPPGTTGRSKSPCAGRG